MATIEKIEGKNGTAYRVTVYNGYDVTVSASGTGTPINPLPA